MTDTDKTRQKLVESMRMSKSAGNTPEKGAIAASSAPVKKAPAKKAPAKKKAAPARATAKRESGHAAAPTPDAFQSPGRIWPD